MDTVERDAMESGQLTKTAAEVYQEIFVPALFGEWAPRLCDALSVGADRRVLDVACGTGCLAREAARRGASVTGLDCNAGMLAVARQLDDAVDWREGTAEALPFEDTSFDAAACQFGLMFFDDRVKALRQMWRVTKPGGRMAVAVWDSLDRTPGYAAMVGLLQRLFGEKIAAGLRAPFVLGEPADLRDLFETAGIPAPRIETIVGSARFPSIEDWVCTDVKGWTLADAIDEAQYAELQAAAQEDLQRFRQPDGTVAFDSPAHFAIATKA